MPWSQVRAVLRAVPGKVLLAVDTCHSGGVTGARALSRSDYADLLRDAVTDEVGLITFASCLPHEVSLEDEAWRNGALTKAMTEGLAGGGDLNKDGVVTLAELDAFIAERVKALTGGRQHATTDKPTTIQSTLPLAVVK
ncbi:MAG: hypothetical protein HZB16_22040 [Armatimonadetes bacterium]|nr:hypothetical protein [Armatimonadota bacterium]